MWEEALLAAGQSRYPGAGPADFVHRRQVRPLPPGALPTMALPVTGSAQTTAEPPGTPAATLTFALPGLAATLPFARVTGHRLSLAYQPATADDAAVVQVFGWVEGTPGYLLQLQPVLLLDGEVVATGTAAVPPGSRQELRITLQMGTLQEHLVRPVVAGSQYALLAAPQPISRELAESRQLAWLRAPAASIEEMAANDLLSAAYRYTGQVDYAATRAQELPGIPVAHGVRVMVAGFEWRTLDVLGMPFRHGLGGRSFDAARIAGSALAPDSHPERAIDYWQIVGAEAGYREAEVFVPLRPGARPVTTMVQLASAVARGDPLQWVCRAEGDGELPILAVSAATHARLQEAFDRGLLIISPSVGYGETESFLLIDPATGASGYFIATGGNGAWDWLVEGFEDLTGRKWWEPLAFVVESGWFSQHPLLQGLPPEQRHALAGGLAVGLVDGAVFGLRGEFEGLKALPEAARNVKAAAIWAARFYHDPAFRAEVILQMVNLAGRLQELWQHRFEIAAALLEVYGDHIEERSGWSREHELFPYWAAGYAPGFSVGLTAETVGVALLTDAVGAVIKAAAVSKLTALLRFLDSKPDALAVRLVLRTMDEVAAASDDLWSVGEVIAAVRKDYGAVRRIENQVRGFLKVTNETRRWRRWPMTRGKIVEEVLSFAEPSGGRLISRTKALSLINTAIRGQRKGKGIPDGLFGRSFNAGDTIGGLVEIKWWSPDAISELAAGVRSGALFPEDLLQGTSLRGVNYKIQAEAHQATFLTIHQAFQEGKLQSFGILHVLPPDEAIHVYRVPADANLADAEFLFEEVGKAAGLKPQQIVVETLPLSRSQGQELAWELVEEFRAKGAIQGEHN